MWKILRQLLAKNRVKIIFQDKLIAKMKLSCFLIASASAQVDLFADDMLKSDFYGPISDEYQVKVQKPNDVQCCSTLKVIFWPTLIPMPYCCPVWSPLIHFTYFDPLDPFRLIFVRFRRFGPFDLF